MPIRVVCPGCYTHFKVSDKFAGQSGPCPKCKKIIQVPEKSEEIKVHTPTEFAGGGRSASGELVTKPITFQHARFNPLVATLIGAGTIIALVVTWAVGDYLRGSLIARAVGLVLVSPPLVLGGYFFLRDDERVPYRGLPLYVRAGICALGYAALWGAFAYATVQFDFTGELWNWAFFAPPFLVMGALVSFATLDLEFGNGFFHYAFYVMATVLLRWVAGMGWL